MFVDEFQKLLSQNATFGMRNGLTNACFLRGKSSSLCLRTLLLAHLNFQPDLVFGGDMVDVYNVYIQTVTQLFNFVTTIVLQNFRGAMKIS